MKGKTMGSYILPLEEIKYRVIQDGASFIGVDHLGGRRKALRVIFEPEYILNFKRTLDDRT